MIWAVIIALVFTTLGAINQNKIGKLLEKEMHSNVGEISLYKIFLARVWNEIYNGGRYITGQYFLCIVLPFFIKNPCVYLLILYLNWCIFAIHFDALALRAKMDAFEELQEYKGEKYFVREIAENEQNH